MPILKRDKAILLKSFLLAQKVRKGYNHYRVNHHLVKKSAAQFGVFLLVEELDDWEKRHHAYEAKDHGVNQKFVIDVGLDYGFHIFHVGLVFTENAHCGFLGKFGEILGHEGFDLLYVGEVLLWQGPHHFCCF